MDAADKESRRSVERATGLSIEQVRLALRQDLGDFAREESSRMLRQSGVPMPPTIQVETVQSAQNKLPVVTPPPTAPPQGGTISLKVFYNGGLEERNFVVL